MEEPELTHRFYGDNLFRIIVLIDKRKILKRVVMETGILASSNGTKTT